MNFKHLAIIILLQINNNIQFIQSQRVDIVCKHNCDPNAYVNPSERIELFAQCRKSCIGMIYWWFMQKNKNNTVQELTEDNTIGSDTSTFIILEDVLRPNEHYTIILNTVYELLQETNIISLHMDKCSKKYPCEEPSPQYLDDYVAENYKRPKKLPPEEVKKIIKNGIDEIKSMDKKSHLFESKQKELLSYIATLPMNNKESTRSVLKMVVQISSANPAKYSPGVSKQASAVVEQIAKAQVAIVKQASQPNTLTKEVKQNSKKILDTSSKITNTDKSQLTNHRVPEKKPIPPALASNLPDENYPIYNDFDVMYKIKKQNVQKATKGTVEIIKDLGTANILTMQNRAETQEIVESGTCILNILDETKKLKNEEYLLCDVKFYLSQSLVNELHTKLGKPGITFSVIQDDIFWWQSENISYTLAFIEMQDIASGNLLRTLKNPILFSMNFKNDYAKLVGGSIKMPSNIKYEEMTEEHLSVHQLNVKKSLKLLMVEFFGINKIKVAITVNRRPSLKEVQNNGIEVPRTSGLILEKYIIYQRVFAPPGSFCYVTVLPFKQTIFSTGAEENNYMYYNYSVKFTRLSCETYNEKYDEWDDRYCDVAQNTTIDTFYCSCIHLSLFSASLENIESKLVENVLIDIKLETNLNFLVLITIGIVLILYIIALRFFLWKNSSHFEMKKVLFLLDNELQNTYEYFVVIKTGNLRYSETTANICIKLYGTKSETESHLLRGQYEPILQKNSEDWFYMLTRNNLGELKSIEIWTDCHGTRLSWYCKTIEVYNIKTQRKWLFEINKWFSVLNDNIFNIAMVNSLVKPELKTRWEYGLHGIVEHLWFKSFRKLTFPTFTYTERVTLILCIIICNMFVTLFILNLPSTNLLTCQLGYIHFSFDFGFAFASGLITFLLSWGFIFIFSNSAHFQLKRFKTTIMEFKYSKKWRIIAWIVLLLVILLSLINLIIFGLFINYASSLVWLFTSLASIGFCILFETFRVIGISAWKRQIEKEKFNLDLSVIETQKEILFKHYGAHGLRPFFKKYYEPISETEIKLKHETELQRNEMRIIITDIFMFSVYIIILFCVILLNKDPQSHFSAENIQDIFIDNKYIRKIALREVDSQKRLYRYLHQLFLPAIYTTNWYSNWTTNEAGLLVDFNTKLLGVPRIRQIRIRNNTCRITSAMQSIVRTCNSEYSFMNEDRNNYSPLWQPYFSEKGPPKTASDYIWFFQTWVETETTSTIGELAVYHGGGYIVHLGRNMKNSLLVLQYIESTHWIDELTRVIFIDASFYNANENLFNILTIIIEKSATGKYITSFKLRTSRFLYLQDEFSIALIIFFVLLTIIIVVFSWKKVKELTENFSKKINFLKEIWNTIDLLIIILVFIFIILYMCQTYSVSQLLKNLENAQHNEYVSFTSALYYEDVVTIVATLLVTISTVRLWKLLRFLRLFRIFELTLLLSTKYLLAMIFINVLLIFVYATVGFVLFGPYAEDFRTVFTSFVALILVTFGLHFEFDFDAFEDMNAYIGFIYYVGYMFLLIVLLNIFITVIIVSYDNAEQYFDHNEQLKLVQYNMLHFLQDEFKYYRSATKGREIDAHLHAGKDDDSIQIQIKEAKINDTNLKCRPDASLKDISIDSSRITSLHNLTNSFVDFIIEKSKLSSHSKNDRIKEILSYAFDEKTTEEKEMLEVENDLFFVVSQDNEYLYCSKKRQKDMKLIVEYLLKLKHDKNKEIEPQLTAFDRKNFDKQSAIINSLNGYVKKMIEDLKEITKKVFVDKSTNVTFDDLGLEIVESDSEDSDDSDGTN